LIPPEGRLKTQDFVFGESGQGGGGGLYKSNKILTYYRFYICHRA